MLNLKILKMAHLRETKYNDEMRASIAKQRDEGKTPSLANFPSEFAKKTERLPGIVSQVQMVEGRKNVQYLFHWEQKEKEVEAIKQRLINTNNPKTNQPYSRAQQALIVEGVKQKFDNDWESKYGR